jgi:subtilisin-like proprotein convertase family protein
MTKIVTSFLLAALTMTGTARAADQVIHYWKGDIRIDTTVSLDEVVVTQATPADRARLGARVVEVGEQQLHLQLAGAKDLAAVDAQVRAAGVAGRGHALLGHRRAGSEQVLTRSLVVVLAPGADAGALAEANGCVVNGAIPGVPGCIQLTAKDSSLLAAVDAANAMQEAGVVRFATPLIQQRHARRGNPTDPVFATQWHLRNTGSSQVSGGIAGNDINITGLWDFVGGNHLGTGINVAMVDDGLERTHEDLSANARLDLGLNFNGAPGGTSDPSPGKNDFHGTWTAGLVAARDSNGVGGVGVAPRAKLIGVRLIAGGTTESQDAQAMAYQVTDADATRLVHVSSNSWGPDDGVVYDTDLSHAALGPVMGSALLSGVTNGRNGKGIVYVWAAGNGQQEDFDSVNNVLYGGDNLSYDGLASSRYVIAVGAADGAGTQAYYSESGPALLVNAPGGNGGGSGIVTTDRTGKTGTTDPRYSSEDFSGNYTTVAEGVSGTSFSTPIVAGVVALMLEANPALTWRDVKHVLARSSTQNDSGNGSWQTNGAGRKHSVKYGFGRVNTAAAVAMAAPATWVGVPTAASALTASASGMPLAIPDNNPTGVSSTCSIAAPTGFHAEYVELTVSATHAFRGDLIFRLTAPSGTVSEFSRRRLDDGANLSNWLFTSVAHWGENPTGTWTLQVVDAEAGIVGTLTAWSLRIHGYVPHTQPTLTGVTPLRIAKGAGATTITCTGSNFANGATRIRWNGTDLATTVLSATQATAVVPSGNLTTAGTATVTAATPGFDGEATQVSAASVSVIINDPPTITSISSPTPTPTEDTPFAMTVTAADTDSSAAALIFTAHSADQTRVTDGNLVFSGSGATRTLTVTPVPDANGPVTVTVTVSDGFNSVLQDVVLTIAAVNDPPVAQGARLRAQPGILLSDVVSGFDSDGDMLTFAKVTDPSNGTLIVNPNGSFTYQPLSLFKGMDVFTFHVSANGQTSSPAQVFITVAGDPNGTRPLIVSEPPDEQIAAGGSFPQYSVLVDTRRYVVAPTLSFELVGAPAGMTINSTTGVIPAWPVGTTDRHLSFGIVVKDVSGALDTQTVVLRVVGSSASN